MFSNVMQMNCIARGEYCACTHILWILLLVHLFLGRGWDWWENPTLVHSILDFVCMVCTSDCMSRPICGQLSWSLISHVITATTCSVSFMCSPLKTYLSNFGGKWGSTLLLQLFHCLKLPQKVRLKTLWMYPTKLFTCFCFYTSLEGLTMNCFLNQTFWPHSGSLHQW